ncbi:MAG: type I-C CRISPR-associated protein Cas8c/Csd1 [Sedimentisphaerales bacterium]|nr:type I-C CRISPR-associated protein Cas8c/Csd1 [Sedimentisphaerales bacterium]
MLSEAYDLLRSLDEIDFDIPTNHPDVKKPGKNPGYRVCLGVDGLPQIVEELGRESMGKLWYHREGKANAFPVVKIQHALLSVPIDDPLRKAFDALKKAEQSERLRLLLEAINNRRFQLPAHDEQTWHRLRNKARDWSEIFAENDERFLALPHMLLRFVTPSTTPADLLRRLCQLVIQRLEQGRLQDVSLAEKLLIGIPDKKRHGQPAKSEVPVVLDVAELNYSVPVADPRMGSYVSRCLRAIEKRDPDGICALQGVPRPLVKRRFPEPNLGPLGESKLFSKNKDTPCEFRYLKKLGDWEDASKSFPIGQRIAADIGDGLSALTLPAHKGKTWRMVASGKWEGSGRKKREKKDLLLIYCEGQPVISDEAADTFGSDEKEKRDQFENDAKALCRALDGIIKHHPQSRLHLMLIGKADKEKKQVLMHMTIAPQEMLDAAEKWRLGVYKNLPVVMLPFPPKRKGEGAVERQPIPPYPDRIVRLLSSKWVRSGTDELKLNGPALRQVLDIMLHTSETWEEAAKNLLSLTIQRIGPLLVGVAAAYHSGEKEKLEKFKPTAREAALRTVALLGILLNALGREKGVYMGETAFQLGRLLSLADTLHREYCVHMRDRSIPPQLIGNALMAAAADNPEDAIDRLRERMNIYQAWATKISGEEYGLAKWAVKQMGEICYAIKRPLPTKTDQTFRAELFLGYMARSPKENK